MRDILFVILIAFMLGCSKATNHKNEWVCMNYMGDVDSLAELVMQGDSNAFDKLDTGTMNDLSGAAILPYAFLMADKYHYSRAYYLVFWKLLSPYFMGSVELDSINCLPDETKRLAINYLKKGVEANDSNCIWDWEELVEKKLIDPDDYK